MKFLTGTITDKQAEDITFDLLCCDETASGREGCGEKLSSWSHLVE